MDKKKNAWWDAHKPTKRRLIQVYAALLYNANLKGFIEGEIYVGPTKNVCVPGFNCYSCPGAIGACPLGALQNALASSGSRAPYYVLGILMLFGITLGRTICGWLCPLGLVQELLYKIPTPKLPKSRYTRALSWLKYVILAIFVVAVPLLYAAQRFPVPAFCKYICPAGTLEGAMGLLANPRNADKFSMLNILFTRKFIVMTGIFAACVFAYRAFCRFLCPLGAIYGLFSRLSLLGVRVDASKCTHCGRCVAHCRMDVRAVGDHECIHCASCAAVCPTKAIRLRWGRASAPGDEPVPPKSRRLRAALAWTLALMLLLGALWYYNRPAETPSTPTPAKAAQTQTPAPTTSADDARSAGTPAPTTGTEPAQTPAPTTSADDAQSTETAAPTTRTEPAQTPAPTTSPDDAQSAETPAPTAQAEPAPGAAADLPVGYEVGMRCPDFTVPLYGPREGSFAYAPGKATVINFWATWCTPCVGELPHFQALYEAYGDQIDLVAIHSNLVTDDVQTFLDGEGYTLPFALDESGSVIQSLGGSTMLPMTVIVDATGKIVYNKTGSVTYALLESLVAPLL